MGHTYQKNFVGIEQDQYLGSFQFSIKLVEEHPMNRITIIMSSVFFISGYLTFTSKLQFVWYLKNDKNHMDDITILD
ncbi:hypothetical protein NYZ99_16025 [Maribacter litopenaei]|uniref:Uncharacterized protein n=1 Tax=Maribacter litopenaei TaxID=2976127 RepID=A0ABY5Y6U7_9FLAO|nr:hypothetical protein [Maribacter litopenaei]UWX54414.1 hypothetical protein NYZ99_16025 [Maribacter litopenaei]